MVRQGQTPFGTVELDDLDRQIIGHLRANARRSYADISRAVGVSEPTARNRIERLIRTGAILTGTRVNPEALGFPVDAMIGIRVDRGRVPEVGEQLAGMEHVEGAVHGDHRLTLKPELFDDRGDAGPIDYLSHGAIIYHSVDRAKDTSSIADKAGEPL